MELSIHGYEKEGIRSNMYRIPLYYEKHSKMEPPYLMYRIL